MTFERAVEEALQAEQPASLPPIALPVTAVSAVSTVAPLSRREREVAALIARGLSNRQIAGELVVAVRTAEAHVTHILRKLGLRSRAQIAIWALEHGLQHQQSGQSAG